METGLVVVPGSVQIGRICRGLETAALNYFPYGSLFFYKILELLSGGLAKSFYFFGVVLNVHL